MKTKISYGDFMCRLCVNSDTSATITRRVRDDTDSFLHQLYSLTDQTLSFFTVHRERNRQWKEREKNLPPGSVTIVKKGKFARRGCV